MVFKNNFLQGNKAWSPLGFQLHHLKRAIIRMNNQFKTLLYVFYFLNKT